MIGIGRLEVPVTATGASDSSRSWIGEAATRKSVTAFAVTLFAAVPDASPMAEGTGDLGLAHEAEGTSE
jgi:hypothetical protein